MALRAGYYGVKKNLISTISKLAGSKIIKTIGNGLKLTNAGTLSVDIDTATMEFKTGKLAAKSGGSVIESLISETVTAAGEVTLSKPVTDYDFIGVLVKSSYQSGTGEGRSVFEIMPVSLLATNFPYSTSQTDPYWYVVVYGNENVKITSGQTTDKLNVWSITDLWILDIVGIK